MMNNDTTRKNQNTIQTKERIIYLDYLRVFAAITVITIHAWTLNWENATVPSYEWDILNVYGALISWAVPIFVMISGAVFLDKDISWTKIYKKYIFKIVIVFIFWSAIYSCIYPREGYLREKIASFMTGYHHMWFLFMIVGLYMSIPILKGIVKDERLMKYFLLLCVIWSFFMPQVVRCLWASENGAIQKIGDALNGDILNIGMNLFGGYAFYFVLGHYLDKVDVRSKYRKGIYFLGILGVVLTIVLTNYISEINEKPIDLYYGSFTLNILFECVALFVFAKYHLKKHVWIIKELAISSLGIYLVHEMVLTKIVYLYIGEGPSIYIIPCKVIFATLFSYVLVKLLRHIPVMGKYIV